MVTNISIVMGNRFLELNLKESNSLKGIALILLLIHHLFYIQKGQYDDIVISGHGIINILGIICKVCVAIFVFLSGYGLGKTFSDNPKFDIKQFYIRRFTKLFLNYWMIWILFVPIGILFFDRHLDSVYGEGGWLYGILDFFGLINITGKYGYNPTWWFYSCIILLYLIYPIIALTISKYPKIIWFYLFVSIAIIKLPIIYINPIRFYLFPFILGIFLANYCKLASWPKKGGNRCTRFIDDIFSGTLEIGGIIVMVLVLITSCIIRLSIPYALLWDSCIAFILILLYKSFKRLLKINIGLEFLGKHSFNIFLFHTFIYYLYFPMVIYWSRNPIIIFLSLLISSIAISLGIEKLKKSIGFYRLQDMLINANGRKGKPI